MEQGNHLKLEIVEVTLGLKGVCVCVCICVSTHMPALRWDMNIIGIQKVIVMQNKMPPDRQIKMYSIKKAVE